MILFASILLNPVYIGFIFLLYKQYNFKGVIGGILITTGFSIISLPHILLKNGEFSNNSFNLFPESIFYKMIPSFLNENLTLPLIGQFNFGVALVYIGISTLLVIISLMILKKEKFRQIVGKVI
ncbi:MAG: hypothetical protein WC758_08410 [Candidatus Woesearchaeota archaeon]|jgi:hypothetical protein